MKLIYVQGDGVTLKLRLSGAHGEGKVHLTSQKYAEKELDCEPEPWRGFSNGMTGVVIATGNDEHIITVEDFSVYNADSKDHVVTLYYEQDGEEVIIYSFALAQGVTRTITEPIVVQGGSGEEVDPVFENWLTNFFGGDVDEHLGIDREDGSTTNYLAEDGVFRAVGGLSKATGAEINTGTDDTKYTTPKAIADSNVWRSEKLGQIKALVDKPTPADADTLVVDDSAATNAKKSVTWANVKATLKTYFDTLYNNYVLPLAGAARGGVKADTAGAGDTVEVKVNTTSEKLFVPTYPTVPVKATGSDINTGSDDAKFATSKAIADSNVFRSEKSGQLAALTGKTTLANGDTFVIDDSASSNAKKSVIWTSILASAKTYFDTLYNNYVLPLAGAVRGGVKADTKGAGDTVEVKIDGSTEKLYVPTYPVLPVKATGAEINTGSDDAKFVTPKSVKDSNIFTKEKTNQLAGLTGKVTPVDADVLVIDDSAAGNDKKGLTWANLKATLKTYFDTLYNKYVHPNHSGDVTSVGDGAQTIAATAISGKADAGTLAGTEEVLVNAGGTLKKTTVTLLGAFSNLWQRSGTTLSPATTGDSVSAKTFSSNNAAGNGGNFVGSVFGVIGTGTAQAGVIGNNSGNAAGVSANNVSGTAATFIGVKTTALTDTTGLLQTDSHATSGTAAAGFGGVKQVQLSNVTVAEVRHILTSATSGAFTAIREWWGINAGTLARKMALAGNGQLTLDTYGANTHTGTVAKYLAVTSAGAVIEADGGGGGGTDEKVKYNADDTTAGYLADKTVAGTGITLAEGSGGDADKLKITNSDTGSAAVGTHESTYDHTKLHDPATAGTGISITGQVVTNTLPSKWNEASGVYTTTTSGARVELSNDSATKAPIEAVNANVLGSGAKFTGSLKGVDAVSTNGVAVYGSGVSGGQFEATTGAGVLARNTSKTDAGALRLRKETDATNTEVMLSEAYINTSGTAADGYGAYDSVVMEASNGTNYEAFRKVVKWTSATLATLSSQMEFWLRRSGTWERKFAIKPTGQVVMDQYGAGNITGTTATFPAFNSTGEIIEATAAQRNRIIISRSVSSNNTNFAAGDLGKQVISTAATAINLVIPLATLVVGDVILVKQSGAGQVTITAADGSKQTFENTAVKTSGVGSVLMIECVDATTNAEVYNVIGGVA